MTTTLAVLPTRIALPGRPDLLKRLWHLRFEPRVRRSQRLRTTR